MIEKRSTPEQPDNTERMFKYLKYGNMFFSFQVKCDICGNEIERIKNEAIEASNEGY